MTEPMRWRMFGYMLALFIAGFVTGAVVMSHQKAASQTLKIGRTDEITSLVRQKLITGLELTPQQRDKFEPLIKKTSEEMEASHLDCLNRISAAVEKMHAQMLPDLTPEQRERLKKLEANRRVRLREKYNYPPEPATKP